MYKSTHNTIKIKIKLVNTTTPTSYTLLLNGYVIKIKEHRDGQDGGRSNNRCCAVIQFMKQEESAEFNPSVGYPYVYV